MKRLLFSIIILLTISCNDKEKQNDIRENESINIIQSLIEQKGKEMVRDYETKENLQICLNLKKIIINAKCFEFDKTSKKIVLVKLPKKTFNSQSEVCLEKVYKSKPINNIFFQVKDSIDIINQNTSSQTYLIPKFVAEKFETIESNCKTKKSEKYIQFSYPIFSEDNTKAYLEYDHYSKNENFGKSIYLEKVNGKWNIKYIERNWNE